MKLIDGHVEDERDRQIADLHDEIRSMSAELENARREALNARRESNRAVGELRRQLHPLYRALQAVFGEIDAAGGDEGPSGSAPDGRVAAVWESWKVKLGSNSAPARIIDALLQHGQLNVAQIKVAAKMATQTVYDATSKLNRLGLINKSGGRYSLKQL